jgi:hypothetical protein
MIRQASKGGAALHRSPLTLISCDAGQQTQSNSPPSQASTATTDITPPATREVEHLLDILDPATFETPQHSGYSDVTVDIKSALNQIHTSTSRSTPADDPTQVPSHLPRWVLSQAAFDRLRQHNHGVTPDILYARGIPNSTSIDLSQIDKKGCSLLLVEVGFCSDLNLRAKLELKTQKYQPLIAELLQEWGHVDLVCIPIGHAGTTLRDTAGHLAEALARRRPGLSGRKRTTTTDKDNIDRHALKQDAILAHDLLLQLTTLASTRLLQTLAHRNAEICRLTPHRPFPFAPRKRKSETSASTVT